MSKKNLCNIIGHMGKRKRKRGYESDTYKCYNIGCGYKGSCGLGIDVSMFDYRRTEQEKGLCPRCNKKMSFARCWIKYIDCNLCKKQIYY